jgi:hypothetical protein
MAGFVLWKEEHSLSKKRFTIFALVAILTLAFAGSAFAAADIFVWSGRSGIDSNWSTPGNWDKDAAAINNYPGESAVADDDEVVIPAAVGRTITIDEALVDTIGALTVEPGELGITDRVTIRTAAGGKDLVLGVGGGITATSNLIITGAGKVTNAAGGAVYDIDEDVTLEILAVVDGGAVDRRGQGTLIYSATEVPAALVPVDVALNNDGGTFTISKRGLAAQVSLGNSAVFNILEEATLNDDVSTGATDTSITTTAAAATPAVVNIPEGVKVTAAGTVGGTGGITGNGSIRFNVADAGELVLGTSTGTGIANAVVSVNVADGGTLTVNETTALRALNVEPTGHVDLNVPAAGTFTLNASSTVSGDISGNGTLVLTGAANTTFKLLGGNNYSGTALTGGAGTPIVGARIDGTNPITVEISDAGSFGIDPIQFVGGANAILKVPASVGALTLRNDIYTTVAGTIEVPANTALTLTGGWTATAIGNGLTKTGDGDLVLNGYQVAVPAGGIFNGGIAVNRGTLVLADNGVAGTNPITVLTGASLRPGFSGITHSGALTFGANSTLLGLSEANKDEPLIIAEGGFGIGAPLIVVTEYAGTWTKADTLKVVEYVSAGAPVALPANAVRARDADGNWLETNYTVDQVSQRYTALSITPRKDYIYPEISPATATVKSTDLTFSLPVPVTSTSGIANATAEFVTAGAETLILTATPGDGVVTVGGPIPEEDGTYNIELTVTATSNSSVAGQTSQSVAGSITLVVKTDGSSGGGKETPVGGAPNADGGISLTATITTSSGAPVTSVAFDTGATAVINDLNAIGVDNVEIVGATVVITGAALTDIGEYSIPILVNGTEKQTVKVTIDPRENTTDAIDTTAQNWKGTYDDEDSSFELYIPTDVTTDQARNAENVDASYVGLSVSSIAFDTTTVSARGADGVNIKVTGNIADETTAAITAVTYRIGIDRYTQSMNVRLIDTDWTETNGPGNGGGGCDAGFGAFSLLAVLGGAALLRRKG